MSVISLDKQLMADIKLDDRDLPHAVPNFLEELYVIENVAGAPVLSMLINDSSAMLSDTMPLTDSNKFSVTLGNSISDLSQNQSFNFRLFNWKGVQFQQGFKYKLNAIFDNYKLIKDVVPMAYSGTSNYVFEQVSAYCNVDLVPTQEIENRVVCSDSQNWLNFSDTLATFLRKVVQHSYSPNACMAMAICANGDLVYKDIVSAINGPAVAEFSSSDTSPTSDEFERAYLMREFSPSSSAGFMNAWLNYGYSLVEDSLDGSNDEYSSTSLISTSGGSVPINKDISDSLANVRSDYAIQDCGNTHPRYFSAFHSNLRILSLFSQKLLILVDDVTNLSLLDVIKVTIVNGATGKPTSYSGKYLIGAKKTLIKGTKYAEIFEVYRNTVPLSGNALLTQDSPPEGFHSGIMSELKDMPIVETGNNPIPSTQYVLPTEITHIPNASLVLPKLTIAPKAITPTTVSDGSEFSVKVSNLGDPVV